jgi:hypothetical protein
LVARYLHSNSAKIPMCYWFKHIFRNTLHLRKKLCIMATVCGAIIQDVPRILQMLVCVGGHLDNGVGLKCRITTESDVRIRLYNVDDDLNVLCKL